MDQYATRAANRPSQPSSRAIAHSHVDVASLPAANRSRVRFSTDKHRAFFSFWKESLRDHSRENDFSPIVRFSVNNCQKS